VDTLPARSITTYVIDGVSPIAPEPGYTGSIHPHGHPELCFAVAKDTHGPTAAAIQLADCQAGDASQTFTYDPATGHVTVYDGAQQMCLNVWGSVANRATLGTWACEEVSNERFSFDPFRLQFRVWEPVADTSGTCFDLVGHDVVAGAGVFVYECATSVDSWQQFDTAGG
jgi:hypothetical protein